MNLDTKRRIQLGIGIAIFIGAVSISYFFGVTEATEIQNQDIYLVLDISGSMNEPPSKLESAKNAANEFINAMGIGSSSDFRVGLIVFESKAYSVVDLTNDQNKLNNAISQLQAGGSTAMGDAIFLATQKLSSEARPGVSKTIVLLADGQNNEGKAPLVATATTKAADIFIFAVGYGQDADMFTLNQIALITGGKSYEAATGQDLVSTFEDIASVIISPAVQYGSRILILIALPVLLFIPAIEKGFTTMIGKKQKVPPQQAPPSCPRCTHVNYASAKFCAKCGNPLGGGR